MIRITGGGARGRSIATLRGLTMRPTASKVTQAIFDVLAGAVAESSVLDLFAGGGTLGLEALSRGAAAALFVDSHRAAEALLWRNIRHLGFEDKCSVVRGDVRVVIRRLAASRRQFDLIFLDPPYDRSLVAPTIMAVEKQGILAPGGIVVAEHSAREDAASLFLRTLSERHYGDTVVSYLSQEGEEARTEGAASDSSAASGNSIASGNTTASENSTASKKSTPSDSET